jgi:hypothetical protein
MILTATTARCSDSDPANRCPTSTTITSITEIIDRNIKGGGEILDELRFETHRLQSGQVPAYTSTALS